MKPVRNREAWASPLSGVLTQTVAGYYDALPMQRPWVDPGVVASPLEKAISSGAVKLVGGGQFIGTFNAAISAELAGMGGQYDGTFGWNVPITNVPVKIRQLARKADEQNAGWVAKLGSAIAKAGPITVIAAVALPTVYRFIAGKVAAAITETTGMEVTPPTDPEASKNFTMTVEEAIRGFSARETRAISKLIKKAAENDWPAGDLEIALRGRAAMGEDRAKMMARQGMAIAATELKAAMYISAGLPKYRWKTKGDGKVRSDHEILDGEIFDWSNPPLVNHATGLHAHPGQDWNCRCEAVPMED
jgi:SPP1 gp7 family putative phage head morphogenesis protein